MNKVEFTQAIEFLEQGRSLLSSQMRGLRTPLNRLSDVNKTLAERFESCNRRLETLIMSYEAQASGSGMGGSVDRASYQGQNLVDEMLVQMRRSTEDQEAIINDLRRLPRFENFLRASFFEVMHQAASEGPIIVLNHS
ncbi:hypothetical protein A7U60_g7036 [Sanghuangporus baumii]|uniref:Uncharacterized protein n=1 Tax=Sanghuangporus baumii TaxID=108892 RepID=A0A9Q5HTV5_SANBA|nr:hypothetical protein A7U60_g7036 [Sanghuangporus baumii]